MGYEIPDLVHSIELAVSYKTGQYRATKRNASGKAALPTANGRISGVIQENLTAGETSAIMMTGITIAETGGAFADGAELAVDSSGRFILAAGATTHIVGEAWEPSTGTGQYVAVALGYRGLSS